MEEAPTNSLLDDSIISLLEKIEEEIRQQLEARTGLQLLDHQFEISLTWNEKEQHLDLDIDTKVEFPPIDQSILQQLLDEVLQKVESEHEKQLQIILNQLKKTSNQVR